MEELPACALTCLGHAAVAANCSITDIACACNSEIFVQYTTLCVSQSCTIREALFTQNQTSVQCHVRPHTDKRFVPVIITFFILALFVVFLRIVARLVSKVKFWYDDYVNFVGFLVVAIYTWWDVSISKKGLGVDIWAVPQENISNIFVVFIAGSCLYLTSRTLTRVSILLFYLRIFRVHRAKGVITWTLGLVVLLGIIFLFPIVFQCSPAEFAWRNWDGDRASNCINFRLYVWIATSIGIALDFWIVLIACTLVSGLQLRLKRKVMAFSMFAVGLVTIAISIARLPYIDQFTGTKNPTIDWVPIKIWSALENYIGVICACLPSLPGLIRLPSALRTLSTPKKSTNLSTSLASQGAAAAHVNHEADLGKDAEAAYEMSPTSYRTKAAGEEEAHHDEDAAIVSDGANSTRIYHGSDELK